MALVTCPECKKEISSEALTCPHCGYVQKKPEQPAKKNSGLAIGVILVIAFFLIWAIIGNSFNSSRTASSSYSSTTTSTPYHAPELPVIDVAPGMTEEQLKAATLRTRKKVDEVKNITWYYHQSSPYYSNSRTAFSIYFGLSAGSPYTPRLLINYVSDDWLFVGKYIIKADDASFEITPEYGKIETDNGTLSNGEVGIWEWYDNSMSRQEMEMVLAIIQSKKAIVRFEGKQYYKDHIITQQEKLALKEILAAWKQLGGVFK
jgi:hypothetical protein